VCAVCAPATGPFTNLVLHFELSTVTVRARSQRRRLGALSPHQKSVVSTTVVTASPLRSNHFSVADGQALDLID
jgi:hypothetical protein